MAKALEDSSKLLPRVLPRYLTCSKTLAGQSMGLKPGEVFDPSKKFKTVKVGKFGKSGFQIAKYFIPYVGQQALRVDLVGLGGRAIEVGPGTAGREFVEGMLESANVFDPRIGNGEKIARGMNAILLGYGLTHGAIKAYETGNRGVAAFELTKKLNVNMVEAYKLLKSSEEQRPNTSNSKRS